MKTDWSEKKRDILRKLLTQKNEDLKTTNSALEKIKQTAMEAPGRMESRYDSTKQEYGYLVNDTLDALERIDSETKQINLLLNNANLLAVSEVITNGSIIKARLGDEVKNYMLLSFGTGESILDKEFGKINIITSSSPIGAALLGRKVGDVAKFNGREIIINEVY